VQVDVGQCCSVLRIWCGLKVVEGLEMSGSQANAAFRPARLKAAEAGPADSELFASRDGSVAFRLSRVRSRLFVQRTHRRPSGAVAVQYLLIDDPEGFRQWCEVEPTRFEHPILFERVKRYGDEALAAER
jgi:hypothetical protein